MQIVKSFKIPRKCQETTLSNIIPQCSVLYAELSAIENNINIKYFCFSKDIKIGTICNTST